MKTTSKDKMLRAIEAEGWKAGFKETKEDNPYFSPSAHTAWKDGYYIGKASAAKKAQMERDLLLFEQDMITFLERNPDPNER